MTLPRSPLAARWSTPLAVGMTLLVLGITLFELSVVVPKMISLQGSIGVDFHQYQIHARRWLSGGGFYLPEQLSGPYHAYDLLPPLYPPTILYLLVPFLWLPELLWWIVPLGIITGVVAWWRPSPWTWVLIALMVAWPRTYEIVLFGNPSLWIAAFAALGTRWAAGYLGVLLKPSLFPLALLGIRHRSWWIGLGAAVLLSLPFGVMWLDYAKAIINSDQGWTYSLRDVPIVLIPVIAWAGRTRGRVLATVGAPVEPARTELSDATVGARPEPAAPAQTPRATA